MQRLRQKQINDFIKNLNFRELEYIKKKVNNKIYDNILFNNDFTIKVMGKEI